MMQKPGLVRLLLAGTALAAWPVLAQAQTPPARVGQVSYVSGNVSFNGAGSNGQWVAATPNYPVTAGDSLFTQGGAEAALAVDASRITLAPNTEVQISRLDDENFAATVSQGEVFLHLSALQPGQDFVLSTPGGAVTMSRAGEYDVVAGGAAGQASVTVLAGEAAVEGVEIGAGQAAVLGPNGAQVETARRDAFADHVLAEIAPPPPPYVPPVVEQMTGVNELSSYGDWDQDSDYGAVWYPHVEAGWAPYRQGHWAFIPPWGWTWVDDAPWGFAPFHYGRWIEHGDRWGWVPEGAYDRGERERPIYAPAVVSFFGVGLAAGITIEALSHGSVGWVPLAPGEAYYPRYHTDQRYDERVNYGEVHDFRGGPPPENFDHYANRRGATYVPAEAMRHGEPVGHYGHPVPSDMFHEAAPVHGNFISAPVRPDVREMPHTEAPPAFHAVSPQTYHAQAPEAYHPQTPEMYHPHEPQSYQPKEAVPYHPQMPQNYHPQESQPYHPQAPEAYHPPAAQDYHPQAPQTYHPPAEQPYHPQAEPAFHPPAAQEFHPAPAQAFHPQPQENRGGGEKPEPARPQDTKTKF
jgi:hypothetical protein